MLQATHKNTVKAAIRKNGEWSGYIAPDKVSAFHVNNGWHIGMPVTFYNLDQLETTLNDFSYYNCNYELGYRVRFWAVLSC